MSYTDDRDEIAELFGATPRPRKGYSDDLDSAPTREPAPKDSPPAKQEPPAAKKQPQGQPQARQPQPAPARKRAPSQPASSPEGGSKTSPEPSAKKTQPATPTRSDSPAPDDPADPISVRVPVKLRPPSNVSPHPLDEVKAASTEEPKPAQAKPSEPVVEDEEILVYNDLDLPDFSESDFVAFDEGTKPASLPPKGKPSRLFRKSQEKAAPKAPSDTPVAKEGAAPTPEPKAAPPSPSETPPSRPEPAREKPTAAAPPAPARKSPPSSREGSSIAGNLASAAASVSSVSTSEPLPQPQPTKQTGAEGDSSPERTPPTGDNFLLDTNGLVKIYDGRTVVNGVDINVRPGEIVGLLGPNGAGKTTSFYMIVGLVPPNGGQVLFNNADVTHMPMYQRARLGMGYLPQEESIFRKLTVEQNIMAVMETLKISRKEKVERCNELLERFSITHIRDNVALTCSGGEKRRLTIARSLVTEPSLIMLDEPFSGVDPIAVNEIQGIVSELRESGLAILITDHNARQTLELVDRAYLIYEGKVLREGSRDFLINDPVSRELYLGDRFTM